MELPPFGRGDATDPSMKIISLSKGSAANGHALGMNDTSSSQKETQVRTTRRVHRLLASSDI